MVKGKKINKDAGELLKNAISAYKKTQIEMANELNLSTKQLQNYSKGEFPQYKSDNIKKLDELLGTKIYELLYEQKVLNDEGKEPVQNKDMDKEEPSAIEKTLQDLAAANKLLAEANIIFAEAQRNFSESNRTLAETNKQLMYRAGPTVGSGSQKGAIALATTAALQDLLFEKLAPMFETTKEELDEVLRNKVSAYRNLRVKDRIQTG